MRRVPPHFLLTELQRRTRRASGPRRSQRPVAAAASAGVGGTHVLLAVTCCMEASFGSQFAFAPGNQAHVRAG
jgi:hypothetical protein